MAAKPPISFEASGQPLRMRFRRHMMEELPDHLSFSDPTVREAIEIVSRACKRTAEDLEKERTTGKPTEVRGAQIALEAVGTNVVYEQD